MRRTVIVLPNLLGATPDDSPLLQKLETLRSMTELGQIDRLNKIPEIETIGALWLGMKPDEGQMRAGPLTVSALGYDPPDRSTHFQVSMLGFQNGKTVTPPVVVPPEDLRTILEHAKKLNTKSLTLLNGEGLLHALVWESLGDLHTSGVWELSAKGLKECLPEGDGEKELRRFIDDSINVLSELELNDRRIDEGLPPLNLLWPWGHGVRKSVPNLLLKRGERAHVESNSLPIAGLTRLVGYRHGNRHAFGELLNTRFDRLASIALNSDVSILIINELVPLRVKGLMEELHWFIRELDTRLLKPLFENALKNSARITLIGPNLDGEGLSLSYETHMVSGNIYPFDERSLEEKALRKMDAWTVIERALTPPRIAQ